MPVSQSLQLFIILIVVVVVVELLVECAIRKLKGTLSCAGRLVSRCAVQLATVGCRSCSSLLTRDVAC